VPGPDYKTPPLVEAIFEAYFRKSPGWSELSYKRLEERLRARFDGKRDVVQSVGVEFQLGPEGQVIRQGRAPEVPRQQRIWTKDGGELFQFSPAMCAYNLLSRYTHFDEHAADIESLCADYLAEAQPTATNFLGQRYINRVVLPEGTEDPAAYFEVYPKLPSAAVHRPFALQLLAEKFADGEVMLNLAYQGEENGKALFFLDVYARSTKPLQPLAAEIRMWHERAHPVVHRTFEAALTAKSRDLFGLAKDPA